MEELSYVSEESQKAVRDLESALLEVPEEIGVYFAAVQAVPAPGGKCSHVNVAIGVSRDLDALAGAALVQSVAARAVPGIEISTVVYRGSARPQKILVDAN